MVYFEYIARPSTCKIYFVNLATELFVLLHNGRYFSDQSRFA